MTKIKSIFYIDNTVYIHSDKVCKYYTLEQMALPPVQKIERALSSFQEEVKYATDDDSEILFVLGINGINFKASIRQFYRYIVSHS